MTASTDRKATISITTWGADRCNACNEFGDEILSLTFLRTNHIVRLCPVCLKALVHLIELELRMGE